MRRRSESCRTLAALWPIRWRHSWCYSHHLPLIHSQCSIWIRVCKGKVLKNRSKGYSIRAKVEFLVLWSTTIKTKITRIWDPNYKIHRGLSMSFQIISRRILICRCNTLKTQGRNLRSGKKGSSSRSSCTVRTQEEGHSHNNPKRTFLTRSPKWSFNSLISQNTKKQMWQKMAHWQRLKWAKWACSTTHSTFIARL